MTTGGFILNYSTNPDGPVALDRTDVLLAVSGSAALWFLFTLISGFMADKIGRKNTYLIGFACLALTLFPLFWLINSGDIWILFLGLALFTVGLGLTYGPQAAWYSEIFPASIRFSGVSVSYAVGAIIGGAFAPTIASALVKATGSTTAVSAYLLVMIVLAAAATMMLRDRPGIDLSIRSQAEQEVGATIFDKRRGVSTDDAMAGSSAGTGTRV
jgi:MFS family permease